MIVQRKDLRRSIETDAIAYLGCAVLSRSLVRLTDISGAGLSFNRTEPIQDGAPVLLTFCVPGTARPCTVQGTVVYSCPQGMDFRIGLRLRPEYRQVLLT